MLDLFIIPVCNYYKNLALVTLNDDHSESPGFLHAKLSTQDNSDEAASSLAAQYLGESSATLQFHGIFQPNEITENLTLVYRLLLNQPPNSRALMVTEIDISYEPPAIRTGLPVGSMEDKLGLSVIGYMHDKFIQGIESTKNKEGFQILISLLPDVFDSTNLRIIYEALSGKSLRTVRMLANSMLDSYSIGSNKSGKEGRIVYGRGLIEEVPVDEEENLAIQESMNSYISKPKYDKSGVRRTTLYRKKA